MAYNTSMSRNPFIPTASQETEFSWGPGRFPNPAIDFQSPRQSPPVAQIADPDRRQQLLDLAAMKRTNLNDPTVQDMPAFQGTGGTQHPDYYSEGNTERYGANPPLVRERRWPRPKIHYKRFIPHMEREW
jgi:hypothetical protein